MRERLDGGTGYLSIGALLEYANLDLIRHGAYATHVFGFFLGFELHPDGGHEAREHDNRIVDGYTDGGIRKPRARVQGEDDIQTESVI